MGSVVSTFVDYCPDSVYRSFSESYLRRREKRKRDLVDVEESRLIDSLHSPKRRKLASTIEYIYKALFLEGKDSDVTVNILNKDWKLHKVYLGQSQYFKSMFSGSWNETNKSYVSIQVDDENVTEEALKTVFGSLYKDEVTIEPRVVIGVLATATLFQLEGLIEQCLDIMLETISPITVVPYYHASNRYGAQNVCDRVLEWFSANLIDYYYNKNPSKLTEIDQELMNEILSNPELKVVQTEMTLYLLLKKWMLTKIMHDQTESCQEHEISKCTEPFLMSEQGKSYVQLFKNLRIGHLLLHYKDVACISRDNLIPESWLSEAYKTQWVNLLSILSSIEQGPTSIDENYFNLHSIRCGREISSIENRSWRWNWFSFGVDLVWSIVDKSILVRRQRTYIDHTLVDNPHNVLVKVEVLMFDEQRQIRKSVKTDIMRISLPRSREVNLLTFDSDFDYPFFVFVKILLTSPINTHSQIKL